MTEPKKTGVALLREPFPEHQISKLPKPTISNDEWKKLPKAPCKECGGYHATSKTIHLDYVGHAALTDRLLDADPNWTWEPMALREGLPAFDATGGLWIRLTVCGQTRIGYGHAAVSTFKDIGSREKEVIGDALRNAAMRFGAALDLWHKGELHIDEVEPIKEPERKENGILPGPGVHKPTAGVFDKLSLAQQTRIMDVRNSVVDWMSTGSPADAFLTLENADFDNEEKTALWDKLDSKTRSALKAEKNKATSKELVTQP